MRYVLFVLLHFFVAFFAKGQNNTFPTSGNVGIGTTTPSAKLEVIGDISLPSSSGNKQIFTWSPTDPNWRIGMSSTPGFSRSMATSHVQYLSYGNSAGQGFALGVNGGQSSFEITSGNHQAFFRGNVGIGTTAPTSKLHIADGVGGEQLRFSRGVGVVRFAQGHDRDDLYLYNRDASKTFMVWREEGNVGIGTTTPLYRLQVNSNQSANLRLVSNGSTTPNPTIDIFDNVNGTEFVLSPSAGKVDMFTYSNHALALGTANTERMRIDNNGSVGIGTASPDGFQVNSPLANENAQTASNVRIGMLGSTPRIILDKAGSVPFEIDNAGGQLRIFNPGAVRLVVNSNGYVGIGTGSPDEALTVRGKIHTNEVKVDLLGAVAPDYVFEPTYDLKPLAEIESYIKENKHLPEVPSAKEMEKNGVQLGEMNMLLLKKVEELRLYILQQEKRITELEKPKSKN
jgi:hypothetical protein